MSVVGGWEPWVQPIVCQREEDEIHEAAMNEAVDEALEELGEVDVQERYGRAEGSES